MLQQVMTNPGEITFREVPVPEVKDDQVLVKIRNIGICGSDIHVYHGKHPFTKYPVTQGHEVSGEIAEIGKNVSGFQIGQKVTIEPQVYCGHCYPCRHGKYNLCEELKVMGFQTTGTASEFFAVPASKITLLPDEMTYNEAIEWMDSRHWSGTGKGIVRSQELLERLGNPQDKLKFVHVAGTNGKGSVCACLSKILTAAGYQVGLFVSPHLKRFNDRIYFNGTEIGDEDFARLASRIRTQAEVMKDAPTVFEIMTAMGMLYFAEKQCDLVMLEVGMGGRLDSTNVIRTPEAAVITSIGLDHTKELGDTLEKIAGEKGGIIKTGGTVIVDGSNTAVMPGFEKICQETGALLVTSAPEQIRNVVLSPAGEVFDYKDLKELHLSLTGVYQMNNAAVVIETLRVLEQKGYRIGEAALRKGLSEVYWPGRFERLHEQPTFLVDGSHNPDGIRALLKSLRSYFPDKKIRFLLGILSTKDVSTMLQLIEPLAEEIGVIMPPSEKAMDNERMARQISRECGVRTTAFDSIEEGVRSMIENAEKEDVICATGSLYSIEEIRTCANREFHQNRGGCERL